MLSRGRFAIAKHSWDTKQTAHRESRAKTARNGGRYETIASDR
jgi:hypothetical protein